MLQNCKSLIIIRVKTIGCLFSCGILTYTNQKTDPTNVLCCVDWLVQWSVFCTVISWLKEGYKSLLVIYNNDILAGTPFVKSSRASTLFGFNRQKLKHLRSSSDISVPTSCDDSSSSASVSNMSLTVDGDRKRSLSAQAPRPPKPPSQSSKPMKKVPIMPNSPPQSPTSKECVTYISSV